MLLLSSSYYLCNVIDPNTYSHSLIAATINRLMMIDRPDEGNVSTSFQMNVFLSFDCIFFFLSLQQIRTKSDSSNNTHMVNVPWIEKPKSSLSVWKFLIATNCCLTAIRSKIKIQHSGIEQRSKLCLHSAHSQHSM